MIEFNMVVHVRLTVEANSERDARNIVGAMVESESWRYAIEKITRRVSLNTEAEIWPVNSKVVSAAVAESDDHDDPKNDFGGDASQEGEKP